MGGMLHNFRSTKSPRPFATCALRQATEFVGFGNLLSINCVQAKRNILTKNGSIQLTWTSSTEPIIPKEVIRSAKKSNDLEK